MENYADNNFSQSKDFWRCCSCSESEGELSPPSMDNATMVLVKENGSWEITHTHFSQI